MFPSLSPESCNGYNTEHQQFQFQINNLPMFQSARSPERQFNQTHYSRETSQDSINICSTGQLHALISAITEDQLRSARNPVFLKLEQKVRHLECTVQLQNDLLLLLSKVQERLKATELKREDYPHVLFWSKPKNVTKASKSKITTIKITGDEDDSDSPGSDSSTGKKGKNLPPVHLQKANSLVISLVEYSDLLQDCRGFWNDDAPTNGVATNKLLI
ncbi:hypothetical protein E1B28_003662 [Marasmius oreades]|uniref:Uncharacterized protein n=1 Tax=Marasmius oreades TaxID=181124 RepID=A0A9P8ABQ8_9AGAR|nr:uncharacterized protein E1B28_003662 [Marasmius oreades]KAG7096210.1 hypothetical protein E1B28_003662 [Marasmius oreades]